MTAEQSDSSQEELLDDDKNAKHKSSPPATDSEQATEHVLTEDDESSDAPADLDALQNQITALEQQSKDNLDKALRAQAELENVRKRSSRDIENAHKYALEKFLNDLLPVLDSMELGMNAASSAEDIDSLREGMDLTLKKFASVMEKFGVSEVFPQGEKFNPELHEAVSMQELEGAESGTVTAVMQKGYELNGRLVRPAMVVVAK